MKKATVVLLLLCGYATGCGPKEPAGRDLWRHMIEARLTGAPTPLPAGPCPQSARTREDARAFVAAQQCLDAAVATLKAIDDAGAQSDLAAAYLVRAKHDTRATDLLLAYEAADRAVAVAPRMQEARFNRALALEALGLADDAIAAWEQVHGTNDWTREAQRRREALIAARRIDPVAQLRATRRALPAALGKGDSAAVAKLIAPFPLAMRGDFVERHLPALIAEPTPERLQQTRLLAQQLARVTGESFLVDCVEQVAAAPPDERQRIRTAYTLFLNAKSSEDNVAALRLLRDPLRLIAAERYAGALSRDHPDAAERVARQLYADATRLHYTHLAARAQAMMAFCLFYQSRTIECLTQLDQAIAAFDETGDDESARNSRVERAGYLLKAGQRELSWSESLRGVYALNRVASTQRLNNVLGTSSDAALDLGHPQVALRYQQLAVRRLQETLREQQRVPENVVAIRNIQTNLGIALRKRAEILAAMGDDAGAERDLRDAIVRIEQPNVAAENVRRMFLARIEEVRGQKALHSDPVAAASAFTTALELAAPDYRTFRASLYQQRAKANRAAERVADADADLRSALRELDAEEARVLNNRMRGEREDAWSAYFSRFGEAYRLLIRSLAEQGQNAQALAYAERARAFEPLDLVMRRNDVPPQFRKIAQAVKSGDIAPLQAALPSDTFVIEYLVLDDLTYAWVISHDRFELLPLRVRREEIDRWAADIQAAVKQPRRAPDLGSPFVALLAQPLATIDVMANGVSPRLVIVPDGAMHGLPFAALRDARIDRYLIEMRPLTIAPSATLYVHSLLRDRAMPTGDDVLLVGNPAFDPHLSVAAGLPPLPAAETEVTRVAALYRHAVALTGRSATVPAMLDLARRSNIVHFAGHSIVNAQVPASSVLLLAPSAQDSGALDIHTLLTKLQADKTRLIVLSACSSAGGVPVGPEGVAPLVRPLIAAGVPAVLGTLWDVEDTTASALLVSFHQHFRNGSNAADALRAAQIEMLTNPNAGFRSVFAWAPFQVIGYASSPYAPRTKTQKEKPP